MLQQNCPKPVPNHTCPYNYVVQSFLLSSKLLSSKEKYHHSTDAVVRHMPKSTLLLGRPDADQLQCKLTIKLTINFHYIRSLPSLPSLPFPKKDGCWLSYRQPVSDLHTTPLHYTTTLHHYTLHTTPLHTLHYTAPKFG